MIKNRIAKIIATSLGFGYAPFGPGTFGTALGLIIYVMVAYTFNIVDSNSQSLNLNFLLIALVIIFTWLGTWSARLLEPEWGHDPGKIVIDETIGVWITILFIPFSWVNVMLAFVIFRFFDILKPLGIRAIDEKLHSPFSVMLDDIVAGIYSALTLQLIVYFFQT